jgi:hypothetical protein
MTSTPDTPTNPAPSQKTSTKLRWTSALEGGYYHGVDQMTALLVLMHVYALVLMHAYLSAYAYWVDYVLFTLPPDYAYLSLLMVSYGCLRYLCMLMYVCLFAYGL